MAYEKGGPGVHKESRVLFFLIASFSSDLPPDPILPAPGGLFPIFSTSMMVLISLGLKRSPALFPFWQQRS